MTLTEHRDIVQGTEQWHALRLGLVTASEAAGIITTRTLTAIDYACPACHAGASSPCIGRSGEPIKTMHPDRAAFAREAGVRVIEPARNLETRAYAAQIAAERITGWTDDSFVSDAMERGWLDEPRAIEAYEARFGTPVTASGFMVRELDGGLRIGYSPDGLVDDDGTVECKSRNPRIHVQTVLSDEVPAENRAQVQTALLVSGRAWCDYVSFCGGMPLWVIRVEPDPVWQAALVEALRTFESTVEQMVADYRSAVEGLPLTERITVEEVTF